MKGHNQQIRSSGYGPQFWRNSQRARLARLWRTAGAASVIVEAAAIAFTLRATWSAQHQAPASTAPKVPLLRALWSLLVGTRGVFKGSLGVLMVL